MNPERIADFNSQLSLQREYITFSILKSVMYSTIDRMANSFLHPVQSLASYHYLLLVRATKVSIPCHIERYRIIMQ